MRSHLTQDFQKFQTKWTWQKMLPWAVSKKNMMGKTGRLFSSIRTWRSKTGASNRRRDQDLDMSFWTTTCQSLSHPYVFISATLPQKIKLPPHKKQGEHTLDHNSNLASITNFDWNGDRLHFTEGMIVMVPMLDAWETTQCWSRHDDCTEVTDVLKREGSENGLYTYMMIIYKIYRIISIDNCTIEDMLFWIHFRRCCCSHGNIAHYVLTDPCFSIMTTSLAKLPASFPRPDFSMPFNVWGPRWSGGFPFWPFGFQRHGPCEAWRRSKNPRRARCFFTWFLRNKTTWNEMKRNETKWSEMKWLFTLPYLDEV